ncbi:MAG: N-6 DNA methylase [Oenococcus oeni]
MDYSQAVGTAKKTILSMCNKYQDLFDATSVVTVLFDIIYLYEINPAYAKLLRQKITNIEALNDSFHAIAKSDQTQLAVIDDLNESIQRALLPRIGKDKQLQVFNEICESTLHLVRQQSDRFVLLKAMQDAYVDFESRLNGRTNTPDQINVLMAQLANSYLDGDEPVRIYDPTSGWGGSLIDMKRCIPGSRRISLLGQELNTKAYLRCEMMLDLLDDSNTSHALNNGDALVDDWPFDNAGVDVIINDPPYSMRWNPNPSLLKKGIYNEIGVLPPKSKADFAFVLHGLTHLNGNGTMVIQLPHGVLFRGAAEAKIRQYLLERNYIESVIGLPANLQNTTAIPTMILVLRKNRKRKDVLFIDASGAEVKKARSRDILSTSAVNKIVETYHNFVSIQRYAYVATPREIIENDYNLNIPRYVDTYVPPKLIPVPELENKIVKTDQQLSTLEADSRLIMMKYQ